jgi:diguanylate cyclase (GGDEF)-like protein
MKRAIFQMPRDSILAGHRDRIMYHLAYVVALFVAPFGAFDLSEGRFVLGGAILAVVALFLVDGVAIHLHKRPPLPFGLLLIPIYAALMLSIVQQGMIGILWCYPGVLFCFFVLPRWTALAGSAVLIVTGTPLVDQFVGPAVAVRFAVSLGLTVVVIHIITNVMRELQSELADQAATDPLTGALNRRQMETFLAEAIERRSRSNAPASVLLIDIDHFKSINDRFGHDAGDAVLKAMVALIKKRARRLDRLFRMGGEEFLVLLSDTRGADAVIHAERLRLLVSHAPLAGDISITISIGVAECASGQAVEAWIKQADDALYFAKQEGRNRVVCETPLPHKDPALEIVGADRRTRER